MNVSHASPTYSIADIRSPFGLLRDSVSIPGPVALAMADSITELMSAFAPGILLNTTSMTFLLDQGRGFGPAQQLQVTNSGVFGSLLSTSLTTSASYVTTSPPVIGGLALNESGFSQIMADSTTLLAVNSPYAATVIVQDPTASNNPQVVSLVLVVRPLAHIVVSPTSLNFVATCPLYGPYPQIPSQAFTLSNTGPTGSNLDFQVVKLINDSPWLSFWNPTDGSLAGGASQLVTVGVQPPFGFHRGCFQEILRVSGYSDNFYVDVPVTLTVT